MVPDRRGVPRESGFCVFYKKSVRAITLQATARGHCAWDDRRSTSVSTANLVFSSLSWGRFGLSRPHAFACFASLGWFVSGLGKGGLLKLCDHLLGLSGSTRTFPDSACVECHESTRRCLRLICSHPPTACSGIDLSVPVGPRSSRGATRVRLLCVL